MFDSRLYPDIYFAGDPATGAAGQFNRGWKAASTNQVVDSGAGEACSALDFGAADELRRLRLLVHLLESR